MTCLRNINEDNEDFNNILHNRKQFFPSDFVELLVYKYYLLAIRFFAIVDEKEKIAKKTWQPGKDIVYFQKLVLPNLNFICIGCD